MPSLSPLARVLAGIFPVALSGPLLAAPPAELEAMVVTASAQATQLDEAPASVSVITREQLEQRPVSQVRDLLAEVPGVALTNESQNRKGVSLRGLSSGYTLILVDGKRVSSREAAFRDNDFDLGWLPMDAIERIEVVRGPMSSLYGSDALGGVVNIITRKASKTWTGSLALDGSFATRGEEGNGWGSSFNLAGPLAEGLAELKLSGNTRTRAEDEERPSRLGMEASQSRSVQAELAFTPLAGQRIELDVSAARQARETRDRASGSLEISDDLMQREAYALSHRGKWSLGTSELRAASDRYRYSLEGETRRSQADSVDGSFTLPLGAWNQVLTFGGEWRESRLEDPGNLPLTGRARMSQAALFVEDQWQISESLALTAGTRLDDHEVYGQNWSPRAYLVWQATEGLTIKGGWARAFKAPSLLQLTGEWSTPSCKSNCFIVGTPELEAETAQSSEISAHYRASRWDAGITVFNNEVDNLIDNPRTSNVALAPSYDNFVGWRDGKPVFRYINVKRARIRGLEAAANAQLSQGVALRASWTYTDARDLDKDAPLSERPRQIANLGLDWKPAPDWAFYANARYTGSQSPNGSTQSGGYTSFDLGGAWRIDPRNTLRAGIDNLGNKQLDYDRAGYDLEGRRIFVSLATRF